MRGAGRVASSFLIMQFSLALALGGARLKARLAHTKRSLADGLQAAFWACAGTAAAIRLCGLPWRFGANAALDRARAVTWAGNHRRILGVPARLRYASVARRRLALHSALYHTEPGLMAMIADCAATLARTRDERLPGGTPCIFAPLHVCADAVAAMTVAMVAPRRTHVYSIYPDGYFGASQMSRLQACGLELIQHHPDEAPAQQRAMIRELRAGTANLVIFPDILPQFTTGLLGRQMRTRPVSLFGRPARLHCGAEELARLAGATVIPFYIHWADGRLAIRVFDPCADTDGVARCIEQALREHGDQWLLWHFPSLFYFNDGADR